MEDNLLNEAIGAVDAPEDEMTVLKTRARQLGITFSNNISLEKLREKVAAKLEPVTEETDEPAEETPAQLRERIYREQMRLVRIRITCLDPKKADVPGEIITVANSILGAVRRYVPFGEATDEGWHVPYIIYQFLKNREFLSIRTRRDPRTGTNYVEQAMVREFAIEVLPQLTEAELKQLAAQQAAAGQIG